MLKVKIFGHAHIMQINYIGNVLHSCIFMHKVHDAEFNIASDLLRK